MWPPAKPTGALPFCGFFQDRLCVLRWRKGKWHANAFSVSPSVLQFSSVAQLCPTLCDPMNHSKPGLPVHHQLLKFNKLMSIVEWCHSAISSSVVPFFSLQSFQNQGLFKWVGSLYHVAKYWSFSFNISPANEHPGLIPFRMDCLISLQFKRISRIFSSTTVQKHQF